MKRSTASWTTAVAASALLALPVGSWAQQPTPSTTPRQQTTGAPAPQTGRTPGAETKQGSANEHLRQAQSALADIPAASLTGTAKTRVAELKRHLNALEQAASQKPAAGATSQRSASWSGDVAAADRILSELLDPASTTGATTPAPAGTTGSTATAPKTTTSGKPAASIALDESARTKLQEVRTHTHGVRRGDERRGCEPELGSGAEHRRPEQFGERQRRRATPSTAGTTGTTAAPAPTGTSGTTPTPAEPTATPATPADPAAAAAASSGAVVDSAAGSDPGYPVAHAVAAGRCRDGEASSHRRARHAQPADTAARSGAADRRRAHAGVAVDQQLQRADHHERGLARGVHQAAGQPHRARGRASARTSHRPRLPLRPPRRAPSAPRARPRSTRPSARSWSSSVRT